MNLDAWAGRPPSGFQSSPPYSAYAFKRGGPEHDLKRLTESERNQETVPSLKARRLASVRGPQVAGGLRTLDFRLPGVLASGRGQPL